MYFILVLLFLVSGLPFFAFPRCRKQSKKIDACLILGCPTHDDGTLRKTMIDRLNHALHIAQTTKIEAFILCGGKAHNQFSEAAAMTHYLQDKTAIPLILEEQSTTTYENFKFAQKICADHHFRQIGIVTSKSHASRAYALSKKFFEDISMYEADETLTLKKFFMEYMARWTYLSIEIKSKIRRGK